MAPGRNTQLAQPYIEQPYDVRWRQKRLELLQPEQEQRLAKRRWEAAPYILMVIMIFAAAFAYMCLDAKIGVAGREINVIDTQISESQTLSQRMELELGALSSLARIEGYAKLHLNMVYPDIGAVEYLDPRVSDMLTAELAALAAQETEEAAEEERHPALAVLKELLTDLFPGRAFAINN